MKTILENPLWLLALTFLVYHLGLFIQDKTKTPFLNPILITMSILIGYLFVFNISYEKYQEAGSYISFWLKPSVVALGVPLYIELEKIKKQIIPLIISQFFGSLCGIISVCLIAKLLGASHEIIYAMAPKSVTTPIAIEISNTIGGITSLTVVCVIFTGILGSVIGLKVLQVANIKSPMGKGLTLGTAMHALGVMTAYKISEKHATYATLGLILNGVFTAILISPTLRLLSFIL